MSTLQTRLDEIAVSFDLDLSDAEGSALAWRLDAAAGWLMDNRAGTAFTIALAWLWHDGDFISRLIEVEEAMLR